MTIVFSLPRNSPLLCIHSTIQRIWQWGRKIILCRGTAAQPEKVPLVVCTQIDVLSSIFSTKANQSFQTTEVGELVPNLHRKNKTLTYLSIGERRSLYRANTLSNCAHDIPQTRMHGASPNGLISAVLYPLFFIVADLISLVALSTYFFAESSLFLNLSM